MKFAPNKLLMLLALVMYCSITFAAPPPPTTPPPPGDPIDGGIFIMLIISLLYGFYKMYKTNTKKASN